jgi:uncharacterized protein YjbJ (UPF0337 family)
MDSDILTGKWNQVRGKVRQRWGALTNDDVDKVQGKYTELVGLLQERLGYARDRAEKEVHEFLNEHDRGNMR